MEAELLKTAKKKRPRSAVAPRPATREKILDAALRRFSEKGYLGATTREIALEAGVAEVTLFRHFSSKEALFEAVLSTHSFLPALKEIIPSIKEKPIEEALVLIAQKYLATLDRRKDFIKILLSQSHFFPEKVHSIYHAFLAEIFTTLATYFRDMQQAGILRTFDPVLGARAFLAMFFTYFLTNDIIQFQAKERTSTDAVIREYIGYFMVGTLKQDVSDE
jgi:AcrR family transcriptional regulator